jgi:CRP-like cAMP-binding protein
MRNTGVYCDDSSEVKQMGVADIIAMIDNSPRISEIFKHCPYVVLKHLKFKTYPAGNTICHQGERYNDIFFIVEGRINIYFLGQNGKKYSQVFLDSGNFFGEFEIFDQRPYICSAEAFTNVKLLQLESEYFNYWLDIDKNFDLYIIKHLCEHFYRFSAKAGEDTLYTLKSRICKHLISNINQRVQNNSEIEVRLDKQDLSNRFGVTTRSTSRILQSLQEQNIIKVKSKSIIINDLDKLIRAGKDESII